MNNYRQRRHRGSARRLILRLEQTRKESEVTVTARDKQKIDGWSATRMTDIARILETLLVIAQPMIRGKADPVVTLNKYRPQYSFMPR